MKYTATITTVKNGGITKISTKDFDRYERAEKYGKKILASINDDLASCTITKSNHYMDEQFVTTF